MNGQETGPRDAALQRVGRLLLGCLVAYFVLVVADLALYERVLAGDSTRRDAVAPGVAAVPVAQRIRAGSFDPDEGVPVFEQREAHAPARQGELARAIARLKGQLRDTVEGRRLAGISYVGVEDVARFLGAELHQASPGAPATNISTAGMVVITPDAKQAERNYKPVLLDEPARLIDERLYVPTRAVTALYEVAVRWDEEARRFILKSGERELRVAMPEDIFDLEVDRSDRGLKIFYGGHPIATWRMCVGAGNNTPIGTFHIQNKGVWPGWRAYWGEFMPGGSRRNPLGARWLGTTARGRETGRVIGIHGTNQPSSIGRRISGGCMRLTNAHAIELYDTIPIGTRVIIHE